MKRLVHAALALVSFLVAVETGAAAAPGARDEAELLAQAGEARYRLALLRPHKTDPGPDLEAALRALEESCELDPANLRALAYLGLARLESAARGGKPFDREAFDSVRGPLEDLFRLSRGWADPRTRALLGEVARSVDASLAGMDDAPADVLGWWQSWRGRVIRTAKSAPPASNVVTLVEDLRTSPLAWVRERAAEKLSERTGRLQPGVVEALAKALREDSSPWVRAAAAKALSTLRPAGWDVRLAEALRNDGSVFVRRRCARGFCNIPVSHSPPKPRLEKVVRAALVGALLSDTPRVAAVAALTLGKFGEAEDELLQALESSSSIVRSAASGGLSSLARGKKVLGRLVELLSDEQPGIRLVAVRTMPRACDVSEGIQEKIAERLSDSDARIRAAAAWKFYGRDGPSTEVQARIEKLLQDDDPRVRLAAASVLGKTNHAARRVLESLRSSEVPIGTAGAWTVGGTARTILGELPGTDFWESLDKLRWLNE